MEEIDKFFDDIRFKFPDNKLEVHGNTFYCDGEICGFAYALVQSQDIKSNPFPLVDTIIFDEFIRRKEGRLGYLNNEVFTFLEICHSVFRDRFDTKAFLLSNSLSVINPYFLEFGIEPTGDKTYFKPKNRKYEKYVIAEVTRDEYKREFEELSPFEQMASQHDEYGAMATNNQFIEDTNVFIGKRPKKTTYVFRYIYEGSNFGVWADGVNGLLYVSDKFDPQHKAVYAMSQRDQTENIPLITSWRSNYHMSKLVTAYKKGVIRFESQAIKTKTLELLAKLNVF